MPPKKDNLVQAIQLNNAAIDETPGGDIIFRGTLDPSSLSLIRMDTYQREVLPMKSVASLVKAIRDQKPIPDVVIGMRGANYVERGASVYLQDEVYVIDGLQRISVAIELMRRGDQMNPHLGCSVHFNTTRESENELFTILNCRQTKLAASVLIRNLRAENPAISMLYDLCFDKSFALEGRVCWDQQMKRGQLTTAMGLLRCACALHTQFGPGSSARWEEMADSLARTMRDQVTRKIMRENVRTLFEIIDQAFGIRAVVIRTGSAHLKQTFMTALCRVFANHKNFWDDNHKFLVGPELRKKLATFPINDPDIQRLAGAGSTAQAMIYFHLVQHLNKSKKVHRLVPFKEGEDGMPKHMSAYERQKFLEDLKRGLPDVEHGGSDLQDDLEEAPESEQEEKEAVNTTH